LRPAVMDAAMTQNIVLLSLWMLFHVGE
jgi:hypothetical protein